MTVERLMRMDAEMPRAVAIPSSDITGVFGIHCETVPRKRKPGGA